MALVVQRVKKAGITLLGVLVAIVVWPLRGRAPIVLVGENKGRSAQDNGWLFYRWCRQKSPDLKIYFLARKGNPDLFGVDDDHIVGFWTLRHILYFVWSSILVRSHDLNDILRGGKAWKHIYPRKNIFLDHGMTGFKDTSPLYGKEAYRADCFIVCSDFEAKLVEEDYGYEPCEIACTGFPRFDLLTDASKESEQKEILFMPTWRGWVHGDSDQVRASEYFQSIHALIHHPELKGFLDREDAKLRLYLHINMQPYTQYLDADSDRVEFVHHGQERVQDLINRSALMITDYSSVSWDFFYLKKAVVFYRFDLEEYERKQGALLDLREELFGSVVYDADQVVAQIQATAARGWKSEDRFLARHGELFRHHDQEHCARVFGVLKTLLPEKYRNHPSIEAVKTPEPETWKVGDRR